jgi:hypothetical protein
MESRSGALSCSQELVTKHWTLNQINPVHILMPYFFKVHFNIIHLSMPKSPK